MKPVRVRFCGEVISATPVRQLENGNWLMKALAKHSHGRFDVGHPLEVAPKELLDPVEQDDSLVTV